MNKLPRITLSYDKQIAVEDMPTVTSSKDAAEIFRNEWSANLNFIEESYLLVLNASNNVMGVLLLSMGGVTGTVVDPRIIFATALQAGATSIILAHNHPSGNLKPSKADERLTEKVKKAAEFLDIKLLDHVILTEASYLSFADEGLL